MRSYIEEDSVRPEYRSNMTIETLTKNVKNKSFMNTYMRRLFGELPLILFSITIVLLIFWGYYTFTHSDSAKKLVFSLIGTSVNACIIILLSVTYKRLAVIISNWENHMTYEGWESSLTIKNFCFQFVNAYIILFSFAFADKDYNKMAQSLGINLAIK